MRGRREPARARRFRIVGNRMVGVSLMLFVGRAIAAATGVEPIVVKAVDVITLVIFCAGLQRHSWATGYTARHRESQAPRPGMNSRPYTSTYTGRQEGTR